jgi:hypothetical protein
MRGGHDHSRKEQGRHREMPPLSFCGFAVQASPATPYLAEPNRDRLDPPGRAEPGLAQPNLDRRTVTAFLS